MKKLTLSVVALVTAMAATSAVRAQDVAAGENSFKKCTPCHSIGEGAKNKVGPLLNGIDGRHSGTAEGYSYSDANKNSGIHVEQGSIPRIHQGPPRPRSRATKMAFAGIKNEKEANDLWAYLSVLRQGREEEVGIAPRPNEKSPGRSAGAFACRTLGAATTPAPPQRAAAPPRRARPRNTQARRVESPWRGR